MHAWGKPRFGVLLIKKLNPTPAVEEISRGYRKSVDISLVSDWRNVYYNAAMQSEHVGEVGNKMLVFPKERRPAFTRKLLQSPGKGKSLRVWPP